MWIIWPFKKKNFGLSWTICSEFRRFVDQRISSFVIEDENSLPYPKPAIFEAICILLLTETNVGVLESIELCAFELAFFQKGVGASLHPHGIAISDPEDEPVLVEERRPTRVVKAAERERYDRFKALRDAEWVRMKTTMRKIPTRAVA